MMTYFRWILPLAFLSLVLASQPIQSINAQTDILVYGPVSWSADSTQIAFAYQRGNERGVWVANIETAEATLVIDNPNVIESDPQWSPDGQWIAYLSLPVGFRLFEPELWIVNVSEDISINLTEKLEQKFLTYEWSTDSQYIAITSVLPSSEGQYELQTISLDDADVNLIASKSDYIQGQPQWSPDGQNIAFLTVDFNWDDANPNTIWITDFSENSSTSELIKGEFIDFSWSPNGEYIVATEFSKFSNDTQVILFSMADGTMQNLTQELFKNASQPIWSPDSQWLAFQVLKGSMSNDADIYLLNIETSELINISEDIENRSNAWSVWSPDGKKIIFLSATVTDQKILLSDLYLYDMETQSTELLTLNFTE